MRTIFGIRKKCSAFTQREQGLSRGGGVTLLGHWIFLGLVLVQ